MSAKLKLNQVTFSCSSELGVFQSSVEVSRNGSNLKTAGLGDSSILAVQESILKAINDLGIFPEEVNLTGCRIIYEGTLSCASVELEMGDKESHDTKENFDPILAFAKALIDAINDLLIFHKHTSTI